MPACARHELCPRPLDTALRMGEFVRHYIQCTLDAIRRNGTTRYVISSVCSNNIYVNRSCRIRKGWARVYCFQQQSLIYVLNMSMDDPRFRVLCVCVCVFVRVRVRVRVSLFFLQAFPGKRSTGSDYFKRFNK